MLTVAYLTIIPCLYLIVYYIKFYLFYFLCLLHHVAYYFASFNSVCLHNVLCMRTSLKRNPMSILMYAVLSWVILNKCILLILWNVERFKD